MSSVANAPPDYTTVHKHLGPLDGLQCFACGEQAQEWAYDHEDEHEVRDERGRPYSTNLDHYKPACIGCHRWLDGGGLDTCPAGHERTEENIYRFRNERRCRPCRTAYMRAYRAQKEAAR